MKKEYTYVFKYLAMLLLIVFFYYPVLFTFQFASHKISVSNKIKTAILSRSVVLKFKKENSPSKKEFLFKGEYYDVITKIENKDETIVYAINDKEEKSIEKAAKHNTKDRFFTNTFFSFTGVLNSELSFPVFPVSDFHHSEIIYFLKKGHHLLPYNPPRC